MSEKRGSSPGYGYGWMRGFWMTRPTITWRRLWREVFSKSAKRNIGMSKDPIEQYFMNAVRLQALIHTGKDIDTEQPSEQSSEQPKGVYGEWCRDPKLCAGKGYCPLDPTCGD